jgi:formylglycine-generating enzyme required for sulfatase activity/CRP-like cAMP-binding protein/rhodanese-related sulfurtransferase/chromosome segregation ATPase
MSAATKHAANKNLQELVPLNALSETSFTEIAPKIVIEEVRSGHYLFRKGDHDNQSVYLLDGKVDLIDGQRKVTGEVEAGTENSRYPVANQQPRPLSARAVTKVVIARIDSVLLDAFLNWEHTTVAEATEIEADDNEDWMTRILQSEAFIRISPSVIQRLIISMQPYPVRAGDVVIRQGEEGDFFYSIHKGRCAVTRRESPDGKDVLLSELSSGDFFGEESLLSASTRNASITMLTDGLLMRLGKKDFVELLQKPLVKSVSYKEAAIMVDEGAVWIDVRSAEEYEHNAFEDSVNIPLTELREQIPELVFNAKYIICCDTGHLSISAAFVLSHKGFEAYVLDGGLNALPTYADSQQHSGNDDRQSAEIIDFNQNKEGGSGDGHGADAGSHMPEGEADALSRDQLDELEVLRAEVDVLRQADLVRQETEGRLVELQSEHGKLQDAIDQSGRMVSELQSRLEAATGENRLLQEQYDTSLKSHTDKFDRLERELEQSTTLVESLRSEISAVEQDRHQLQELLGSAEVDRDTRADGLEDEISRLRQQRDALQTEFETVRERAARFEDDHTSFCNEQRQLQENLQSELAQARLRIESLHAELLQKAQQHGDSDASLQEQQHTVEILNNELSGARKQLAELQAELAAERDLKHELDGGAKAELAQRLEELESLREELALARQHGSELADRIAGEEGKSRDFQQQLAELEAEYEGQKAEFSRRTEEVRQQLDASLSEKQALGEQLDSLRQETETLRGENEQTLLQRKQQSDLIEQLTADRQAADEVLVRLQDEWNAERGALNDEIETAGKRLCDLQARLEQSAGDADREKLQLQEELQSRVDAHREQLEQQEHLQAELQQELARTAEAGQTLEAERDDLQTRLDEHLQESLAQQQKIEELNAALELSRNAVDGRVQALGEQLESERQRADEAESRISEQMSQLESLRAELAVQKEMDTGLVVDMEVLQKQGEELREELHQSEERFRERDLESQESLRKLYEDLTRKNETERELQGQIERLRKKLDQSEESLQAARHDERESVENIRNELNAERRARAEERAQMAARQRELKEQLVSVASQHEEVIANRDGVLAQARDDAREEERTRLGQVIALQQQTEQQLAALQDELRLAHEETASAVRKERASIEADLDLARRQKADADAALGQIETQLKQLMEERDAALVEQQSVHDQLNSLRAEVEVARGLMNAERQGQTGDPIRLISELKETRRNIEIAVRLRTEAEVQRDRAVAELDELRSGQGKSGSNEAPTRADKGAPEKASSGSGHVSVPENKTSRVRMGKAVLIVLGMGVLAAFALWFMPRVEIPQIPEPEKPVAGSAAPVDAPMIIPAEQPPVVIKNNPSTGVGSSDAASPVAASQPSQQAPAASQGPADEQPEVSAPAVVRSFRDALPGGGSGPLMVELPAAGYLMGSAGNSLNFDERPQHPVNLTTYAIGKYEVSFAEYDQFVNATGRRMPPDEGWGRDDRPVINVSWKDAEAYTRWLSEQTGHRYRLPSESEWEFAARGNTTNAFWWDGVISTNPANCFDCGSRWDGTRTAPVGSFQANTFGLHDTAGNVQEWTGDCYQPNYQNAPSDGSVWQSPGCTQRVVRGGSYNSPLDSVRSAKRGEYDQGTRLDNLGFRVVRVD